MTTPRDVPLVLVRVRSRRGVLLHTDTVKVKTDKRARDVPAGVMASALRMAIDIVLTEGINTDKVHSIELVLRPGKEDYDPS